METILSVSIINIYGTAFQFQQRHIKINNYKVYI